MVHRFSDEHVDCVCEALLQQYPGSRSRLVMLISSLSSSQLQRYDSEHLLRARAVVAFHTGRFSELYALLGGTHAFNPAHHPLLQKVRATQNTHTHTQAATLSLLGRIARIAWNASYCCRRCDVAWSPCLSVGRTSESRSESINMLFAFRGHTCQR